MNYLSSKNNEKGQQISKNGFSTQNYPFITKNLNS